LDNPLLRKYENGAVGTLTHVIALHGGQYACELEVYADGFLLKFVSILIN
jgi:hypothetical protein